jgi:hypothetical protein
LQCAKRLIQRKGGENEHENEHEHEKNTPKKKRQTPFIVSTCTT